MSEHIKINNYIPRVQYVADGILTTFEFPFAVFDAEDLKVYIGSELQENNYTVSGVGESEGGSITFTAAPADEAVVTIVRYMSIERTSDFQEGGALRASVLNDELDYQIACQQQIADECMISQSTYSGYESGNYLITALVLYTICKNHNLSMDEILK